LFRQPGKKPQLPAARQPGALIYAFSHSAPTKKITATYIESPPPPRAPLLPWLGRQHAGLSREMGNCFIN
jgi:hypothetical protein